MTLNEIRDRLLELARVRLKNRFGAFEQFRFTLDGLVEGSVILARASLLPATWIAGFRLGLGEAAKQIDAHLLRIIDEWAQREAPAREIPALEGVQPLAVEPQAETKQPAPATDSAALVAHSAGGEPPTAWHLMASPHELCAAFGTFTGMNKAWFKNLNDRPALKAARFRPGQGGRNNVEPLFYVYPVLQWLIDKRRKTGRPINEATGWRMLQQHFPKVYEAYELNAPDPD